MKKMWFLVGLIVLFLLVVCWAARKSMPTSPLDLASGLAVPGFNRPQPLPHLGKAETVLDTARKSGDAGRPDEGLAHLDSYDQLVDNWPPGLRFWYCLERSELFGQKARITENQTDRSRLECERDLWLSEANGRLNEIQNERVRKFYEAWIPALMIAFHADDQ